LSTDVETGTRGRIAGGRAGSFDGVYKIALDQHDENIGHLALPVRFAGDFYVSQDRRLLPRQLPKQYGGLSDCLQPHM
jgi:hypothetical protein